MSRSNFHDGRWEIMITGGTWQRLALFSRLCHSADSWQQTGSAKSQAAENAIQDRS